MENKKLATALLMAFVIVITVSFLARIAFADGPPPTVAENLKAMEKNQEILAETREAHQQFETAKSDNERREAQNLSLGWRTNWETMNAVPVDPSFQWPL